MLSGVALRAQVASVIDALSAAAVAEISKVLEEGLVVLRLQVCQREAEIEQLKSNIQVLHRQLRSAQDAGTPPSGGRGGDGGQSGPGDGSTRGLFEKSHADQDESGLSAPEVQVKPEAVERGREEAVYEGESGQWRSVTQSETGRQSSLDRGSGGVQLSPFSHGPLGHTQYRFSHSVARRRPVKRLMFKKGFVCLYCGKCFERAGHLERHKRIHTGEKPYRCETCGRRFNQKCSLKEHMKIHRRSDQIRPVEVEMDDQKQIPEVKPSNDTVWPEEENETKAEEVPLQNEDVLLAPVQVKIEPSEVTISPLLLQEGNEQTSEGARNLGENFTTYESNSQQWTSRLQGQNDVEMRGVEYLSSSAQSVTSSPGGAQLLPAPAEASCNTFSFPGKPNSMISHTSPFGLLDTLLISSEARLRGLTEASANHHEQKASWSSQAIKPKRSFACSCCGKEFKRGGHLERHLRIHTGEKPFGCQVCGRCFNQKSSLKGHMKTHRNGENPDVLESHHLTFTMPSNHQLESLTQTKPDPVKSENPPEGREPRGEQTVGVKVETNGEGFQSLSQAGPNHGAGPSEHHEAIMWTMCGVERSGDAVNLSHDVKYHLSPTASGEQQGYTCTPPTTDQPFADEEEQGEVMHGERYPMMGMQSRNPDVTLTPDLQHQPVAHGDYSTTRERDAPFFITSVSSNHGDASVSNATGLRCFICTGCGKRFNSFNLFQHHRCLDVTERL